MTKEGLKGILLLFIFVILGVLFADTIADAVYPTTDTYQAINETVDITPARMAANTVNATYMFELANGNWSSIDLYKSVNGSTFILDTDYQVNSTSERINLLNTSIWWTAEQNVTNTTYIDYTYFPADYVDNTTARTFLRLITLFFVLGVLLIAIALVKKHFLDDLTGTF